MIKLFQLTVLLAICSKIFALPNDIEKCRINDDNCLVRSANKVLRKYHGGITEIDLQSFDPFMVNKIKLNHDYGVIKANGIVYNVKLHGLSTGTIEKITGFDKNLLEIHLKAPKVTSVGFYRATGDIIGFSLKGDGQYTINFYDFSIKLSIKLERYTRNGKLYFKTVGSEIASSIRTGDLDATSMSRPLVWLLNTSFDTVLKSSLKSYTGDVWGTLYEQRINALLSKVPIEDLFLL